MFLLGILSVFSAAIIPGLAIALLTLRIRALAPHLFAAFFFSIAWTYVKTLSLILIGAFEQPVLIAFFTGETLLLLYALRYRKSHSVQPTLESWTINAASLVKVAASITLLIISTRYIANTTLLGPKPFWSVWTHWDSIVSWNRWALDLANGKMPTGTWGYGQLVPTLWSYTYVFMGTTKVELFAKMLSDLFPVMIALMQIDVIFRKGFFAGTLGWLALAYYIRTPPAMWTFHPMADIPLASAVFASVYFALISEGLPKHSARTAWFACLLSTGLAAAIKQQGLMLLLLGPLTFWQFLPKDTSNRKFLLQCWGIAIGIGAFWYLYFLTLTIKGFDKSNLADLISITGKTGAGQSLQNRLNQGLNIWILFFGQWTVYVAVPAILSVTMYFIPKLRLFIALFLIPYIFIWAVGFSYDIRNALLIFPILCLLFGLGSAALIENLTRITPGISSFRVLTDRFFNYNFNLPALKASRAASAILIVTLISGSAWASLSIADDELLSVQNKMALDKGYRSINIRLAELQAKRVIETTAVTNYEILCYMDRFHDWKPLFRFLKNPKEIDELSQAPTIKSFIVFKQGIADLPRLRDLTNEGFDVAEDSGELLILIRKK